MKLNPYSVWQFAAFVVIGECIGLTLAALFLYNSSFNDRIPDPAKLVLLVGTFVALFLLGMAWRPRPPKP